MLTPIIAALTKFLLSIKRVVLKVVCQRTYLIFIYSRKRLFVPIDVILILLFAGLFVVCFSILPILSCFTCNLFQHLLIFLLGIFFYCTFADCRLSFCLLAWLELKIILLRFVLGRGFTLSFLGFFRNNLQRLLSWLNFRIVNDVLQPFWFVELRNPASNRRTFLAFW